ncbi:unannotated protein [freshwater metagenome]|uniref:Unannotated protein n=1 Tax=freshwater metagenome TaxID=449393 RepID=A0A6J6EFF7_9ZZZZ|nr:hypothetical protein [Actinomycetota bacterium]
MIGVVGPEDSIALIRSVAESNPDFESILFRAYQKPDDAVRVAREVEKSCKVILFSGRLPYALALKDPNVWTAELRFVPHTASDLYRALTYILRENSGEFVNFSLDVLSKELVAELCQEIGMPDVKHIWPFDSVPDNEIPSTEELIDFHVKAWQSGDVALCVTCLGAVHEALDGLGIPSRRVEHSRGSVRDALERARLVSDLRTNQATGIAVAIIQTPPTGNKATERYQLEIQDLRRREIALKVARQLRGQVAGVTSETITVTTSRGVVETVFERIRSAQRSALDMDELPEGTRVGFGIDMTVESAEKNAQTALDISKSRQMFVAVLSDGSTWTGEAGEDLWTRDSNLAFRELSELLGVGPLAFSRLLSALRKLDHKSLTARQLGDAYGIEARSARRLLNSLARAGFAAEKGKEASRGVGRPQTVFEVHLTSMVAASEK